MIWEEGAEGIREEERARAESSEGLDGLSGPDRDGFYANPPVASRGLRFAK
jgi:hypothetical protein